MVFCQDHKSATKNYVTVCHLPQKNIKLHNYLPHMFSVNDFVVLSVLGHID